MENNNDNNNDNPNPAVPGVNLDLLFLPGMPFDPDFVEFAAIAGVDLTAPPAPPPRETDEEFFSSFLGFETEKDREEYSEADELEWLHGGEDPAHEEFLEEDVPMDDDYMEGIVCEDDDEEAEDEELDLMVDEDEEEPDDEDGEMVVEDVEMEEKGNAVTEENSAVLPTAPASSDPVGVSVDTVHLRRSSRVAERYAASQPTPAVVQTVAPQSAPSAAVPIAAPAAAAATRTVQSDLEARRIHPCPVCGRRMTRSSVVTRHVRSQHPGSTHA